VVQTVMNKLASRTGVKMPGIISDVDGVVYRGGKALGNAAEVIRDIYRR